MEKSPLNLIILGALVLGIMFPEKVEQLLELIKPSPAVVVPDISLPPEYAGLAQQAVPLFAQNKAKARAFTGYFEAVAGEVRSNEYLKDTRDLQQLVDRSITRMNEVVNLPSVTDGKQLGQLMEQMLDQAMGGKDIKPLDSTLRGRAADAFTAMEWAVREGVK